MTEAPIVRKVGEGMDKPNAEQELPIDINFQKLVDFMISRQKLPGDWHKRVQAINQKAVEAIKETPASVLASVGGGADAPINYYRAVQIRDKLLTNCEKTIFGGLTGPAAVWDKVVKAYENKCVFLGEAAQIMERNVNYEIPDMRKQGAALDQQITDSDRKHAEYVKSAAQSAVNFQQECAALGVQGSAVRPGLSSLCSQLPQLFEKVLDQLQSPALGEARSYYRSFSQYAHATGSAADMLPTLAEVSEGRTQAPAQCGAAGTAAPQQPEAGGLEVDWGVDVGEAAAGAGGIDWDMDMGAATAAEGGTAAEISWDLDLGGEVMEVGGAGAEVAVGVIDWDVVAEPEPGGGELAGSAPVAVLDLEPTVDWGIDLADVGAGSGAGQGGAALDIDWDVVVGGEEEAEEAPEAAAAAAAAAAPLVGSCSGRSAALQRLEWDVDYRSRLLDDLQELRAFLVQRRVEMRSSGNDMLSALLPESIQAVDASAVASLLGAVDAALAALTAQRLRQLLLIKTSKKYFDRLASSLERKAGQESRLLAAAKDTETRKREARARLSSLAPKVTELVSQTRSMKAETERALARLFAGRRVNILGDINTVLSVPGL